MRRVKVTLKGVREVVLEYDDDDATEISIAGLGAETSQAEGDVPPFGFIPTPTGAPDEDGEEDDHTATRAGKVIETRVMRAKETR